MSFRDAFEPADLQQSVGHRLPIDRPSCSPCDLKFTAAVLDPDADIPYDTKRCDFACVGKWSHALRRLAERSLAAVQGIVATTDVSISLRLNSRGTNYNFKLSNMDGYFAWRRDNSNDAGKDAVLEVTIVVGSQHGLRQVPTNIPQHLEVAGIRLVPHARKVAGQLLLIYASQPTHVRIYSKHRELRGDAPEAWTIYKDPGSNMIWEYMSGPQSKRKARWAGGQAFDVDEEDD